MRILVDRLLSVATEYLSCRASLEALSASSIAGGLSVVTWPCAFG